jgi:quinolinate synthase
MILPEHITSLKQKYPEATVLVHPECKPDVIAVADEVLSTGGMIRFAKNNDAKVMIVGTEIGIIHRLKKENPEKTFIPVSDQATCPNMKFITLEKVLWSLQDLVPEVKVPEDIRLRAKAAVDRMLAVS